MFLKIKADELNIVINLGQDLTKANDVIAMFEKNAQYVKESYSSVELVKPLATVELGDCVEFSKSSYNSDEMHLSVKANSDVVGFIKAENNSFADLDKIRAKYKKTIDGLKKEVELLKKKNQGLEAQVEEMSHSEVD